MTNTELVQDPNGKWSVRVNAIHPYYLAAGVSKRRAQEIIKEESK